MTMTTLHQNALAAYDAGEPETAADLLREAAAGGAPVLNDLAVVLHDLGRMDDAAAVLRTCLTVAPDNADARENATLLERTGGRAWRASATVGGDDPNVPERAYPGMALTATMAEHAMRYSLAMGLVAGLDVLDVGCGTGYGSEMLTWTARSVRGFDLWEPAAHEHPRWPGGAELNYGFDVCRDELPSADAAVMFEVAEHLADAPAALRNVFGAASTLVASFPNPEFHGSHLNPHHVNDWSLSRFEHELKAAASVRFRQLSIECWHQPQGSPCLVAGRDPSAPFWVVVAKAGDLRPDA
jgi:SAM-dependent methyltransferase